MVVIDPLRIFRTIPSSRGIDAHTVTTARRLIDAKGEMRQSKMQDAGESEIVR
jgi:hypothetical protein